MVRLPVDLIDETERLREPDDDHVKLIAASIADCGQIAPIHVRPTKDGRYEMIDGGHRLAAIRAAGQPTILAIVFDGDESGAGWLRTD